MTRTVKEVLAAHLNSRRTPMAVLFVDGEEMCNCRSQDEGNRAYEEAQKEVEGWKEIALMIYKPQHGAYIRTKYCSRGS